MRSCVAFTKAPLVSGLSALLLALLLSPLVHADGLKPAAQAEPAPMSQIVLPRLDGGELSLDDLQGKVVLVDFWASWCGPCRESFPWMNNVQQRYGDDGLIIVGVNLDQESSAARAFLQQVPANFTIVFDSAARLPEAYGLMGMPSSYLLDRQGRIRATHTGFHSGRVDEYEANIAALLAE